MKYIITAIAVFVLLYLGTSFITWQFNPGQWDTPARAWVVILGVTICSCLALVDTPIFLEEEEDDDDD
jgi:hypothetical protein